MSDNYFWFKAHYAWGHSFFLLSDEDAASLARAIWRYAETGEEMEVSGTAAALWPMIRVEMQQDEKDRENGSKGGRPKNPPKNPPFTEQNKEEQRKERHTQSKTEGKTVSAQRYTQRNYTAEELDAVSPDLLEEAKALRIKGGTA